MDYYKAFIKLYGAAGAALEALDGKDIQASKSTLKEAIQAVEEMEDERS